MNTFSIGHGESKSKTFMPHFYKDEKRKLVFADVAGLQDSDGNLVDFINYVAIRYLLANSKRVKIITTVTMQHIMNAKGQSMRELTNVIK